MRSGWLAARVACVVSLACAVALVVAGCGGAGGPSRTPTATTRTSTFPGRTSTFPGRTSTSPGRTPTSPGRTPTSPGRTPTSPGRTRISAGVSAKLAQARRTHEYPTPAVHQTVAGGWRTPAAAVEAFAAAYVNWSAATVAARLRALASVSVGQARSAMRLGAAQAARDDELQRGGIANAGTVEAVAPLAGHPRQYAVVTRERTSSAHTDAYSGLEPAWHVALATVTRASGGLWVLARWQPES